MRRLWRELGQSLVRDQTRSCQWEGGTRGGQIAGPYHGYGDGSTLTRKMVRRPGNLTLLAVRQSDPATVVHVLTGIAGRTGQIFWRHSVVC